SKVQVSLDNAITATDNDDPASQGSQFDITLTDATFEIDPSTRIVSKKSGVPLDRELTDTYSLTLVVTDKLAPFNSMSVPLTITVTDINDNPPVFSPLTYSVTVDESLAIGEPVETVTATDIDADSNGEVSYFITAGGGGKFRIDPNSG
ncbi:cadherin repeat domain-containing protein, partial [Salmonella sp. s51228]|uniref:cadherin repeat domain-containing protein n=1 Tax=Salmonella sp. s51228 TaxID=3159652 RepID=UPI00397E9D94